VTPTAFSVGLGEYTSAWRQLGGWFVNNAGWVTGPECTVLVDTCATETRSAALLHAARSAGHPGAPTVAALTHAHGDHANGAGLVARSGGRVLACPSAARDITDGPHTYPATFSDADWGDITPPASIEPVTAPLRIDTGVVEVEVLPVPQRAHTAGDLVVWVAAEGVLFAGDLLFHGMTPLALSGSVLGWLDALEWLGGFDATHVVPGHGPITTHAEDVSGATAGYLHWLLEVVTDVDEPDFDTLHRQACARWPHWPETERHTVNLRVAHAETHDYPLDFAEALDVMAAAAGGAPISLHL
jgi:cyclase